VRFSDFCSSEGISHEFSSPITPQQNGVVERKNRTLQESTRVMLHAKKLPNHFWPEAMNTACYIHNRVTLRTGISSFLYELWKGRKPTVKYFHVFGSKCYIFADREQRRKMDPKSDDSPYEIRTDVEENVGNHTCKVMNLKCKKIQDPMMKVLELRPMNLKPTTGLPSEFRKIIPRI
jgi:hypothetical protein